MKVKRMNDAQISAIKELFNKKLSAYAISKELSMPLGAVNYHVTKFKKSQITPKNVAKKDNALVAMLKKQMEQLDIKKNVLMEMMNEATFQ